MESRLEISTGDLVEGAVCSPDNRWIMMVNGLIQQAVWNFAADGNRSCEVGSFTRLLYCSAQMKTQDCFLLIKEEEWQMTYLLSLFRIEFLKEKTWYSSPQKRLFQKSNQTAYCLFQQTMFSDSTDNKCVSWFLEDNTIHLFFYQASQW